MSDFDKELDTSGLNCPLPIIKAKKEINSMDAGINGREKFRIFLYRLKSKLSVNLARNK